MRETGIGEDINEGLGKARAIAGRNQPRALPVRHDLWDAANRGGDHWNAGCHGLEQRVWRSFRT